MIPQLNLCAHVAENIDHPAPSRIDANVRQLDMRARQHRRSDHPEGGRADVPGHLDVLRLELTSRSNSDRLSIDIDAGAHRRENPLCVISRGTWLNNLALCLCAERGEDDAALDLRASDGELAVKSFQRTVGTVHPERRRFGVRHRCTHLGERIKDTAHRPISQ